MAQIGRNDPCPCGSGKKYKMCCLKENIDNERLQQIFDSLFHIPEYEKLLFPKVLRGDFDWLPLLTTEYLMLALFSPQNMDQARILQAKGLNPFPGLFSTNLNSRAAFKLDKSRQVSIHNCKVENMISIALGKDCTIILSNHSQSINTIELGYLNYQIELVYIVSFGDEINRANMYDFLGELVAYSVTEWRSTNDK